MAPLKLKREKSMKKHEKAFLMAAVAGITMGLSAPAPSAAEENRAR